MVDHGPRIPNDLSGEKGTYSQGLHEVRCDECQACGERFRVRRQELEVLTTKVLQAHEVPAGQLGEDR